MSSDNNDSDVLGEEAANEFLRTPLCRLIAAMQKDGDRSRFMVFGDGDGEANMAVILVEGPNTKDYVSALIAVNELEHAKGRKKDDTLSDTAANRMLDG